MVDIVSRCRYNTKSATAQHFQESRNTRAATSSVNTTFTYDTHETYGPKYMVEVTVDPSLNLVSIVLHWEPLQATTLF